MKTFVLFLAMISIAPFVNAQICHADFSYEESNGVVYFTNESTPVDSFTMYTWSFGDGGTSDLLNPWHTYSSAGQYGVCLTMSNGFLNCSSTFCDTIQIDSTNSVGNCFASFTFSVTGLDVVFYNQSTWDSGQATFAWDFGDGSTSSDFEPSHHYDQNGYYNACLTISTTAGCTHHSCNYIALYDSNCLITFSYQITGNSVSFLPSNANYGMGTFYWSFGDNSSSSEIAPTHYYNQTGEYSVCLYTDSNCSSHFCDTINITAGDSCYAEFTVYEYNGVVSFHPTFIDYSKMYSWDFGDGTSSNEVTPYHEYPSEGGYVVCLTVSAFFCSATHCDSVYYSNDTTNNNGGDCIAKFEVGDIDTVTSTIWLTDLSQGGLQYFWDFGDGSSSTEQYPSHTYDQNGAYYVCLTITCDSNMTSQYCAWIGLNDSMQAVQENVVRTGFTLNVKPAEISGVFSPSENESLNVYPNPATESVRIVLPENAKGNAVVVITNDLGQTVNQKSIFITDGMNTNEIDIHSLTPGLYLIRVIAEGKSFTANILKQ